MTMMSPAPALTSEFPTCSSEPTPFRQAEKHFKNRAIKPRLPCLHDWGVLDLSRPERVEEDEVWLAGWWGPDVDGVWGGRKNPWKGKERERGERPELILNGLKEVRLTDGRLGWVVAEDCVLIPQYLSPEQQVSLALSSLAEYTLPPNPLSLDTHYILPNLPHSPSSPSLFELYATSSPLPLRPRYSTLPPSLRTTVDEQPSVQRKTIETPPASVLGYEEIVERNKGWEGDTPSGKVGEKTAGKLMREIRWANLGWVYQWSTKSYDFTPETPIVFPPKLASLCTEIVREIPWKQVFASSSSFNGDADGSTETPEWSSWTQDYAPDTGIVNFYQLNDTLMAHVDRAELDPSRPLVSISLGHAAIFLLGSASRNDPPIPIILRSGDVLIMSGKGRQSYHGVPRIMEGTLPPHFAPCEGDECMLAAAKRWIASARININARQVFPPGFQRPDRA